MGRGSTEGDFKGKLLFVNIKGLKPNEKPHFELSAGAGNDSAGKPVYVKETDEKTLSGYLMKAEAGVKTYQEKPYDVIRLLLNDPEAGGEGETYRIEMGFSSISRNIVNALLSADNFIERLEIGVYSNKKGYAAVSLKLGGEKLEWKHSLEVTNPMITKTIKKEKNAAGKIENKEVNDYLELNEFFLKEFKDNVIPKVKPQNQSRSTTGAAVANASDFPPVENNSAADDLPF